MNSSLLVLILIGIAGGVVGHKLGIPSGALFGSMVAVILYKLNFDDSIALPSAYKVAIQISIGIMLGTSFNRQILVQLKEIGGWIILSSLFLIGMGILFSFILMKFAKTDWVTSYLCTSPGGMSALIAVAIDNGAKLPFVVAFHFIRVVIVVMTVPIVVKIWKMFQ